MFRMYRIRTHRTYTQMQNPKGRLYRKGARYERAMVNAARENGLLAFRSAGSHSPIDCVIVDAKRRTIKLIQAKAGKSMSEKARTSLQSKYKFLNGTYEVKFIVV